MKNKDLSKITVKLPCKMLEVLKKIDKNGLGLLFVIDNKYKLIGSISDGDIRRIIIKEKRSDFIITQNFKGINKKPISLPVDTNVKNIQDLLYKNISGRDIKCIPLIDKNKKIVDYSTKERVRKFPILEPSIGDKELSYVVNVIKSGWISSKGSYLSKFEKSFSDYLKGGYSVAVTSGTTALQIAISALGIKAGDEIIVPNFTFGATINAIISCGSKPVIAEVDKETWTLDISKLNKYI